MTNLDIQLADKLKTLLKQTALSVTEQQQQQLVKLVSLLNKWNKAYNLTSVRDPQEMLVTEGHLGCFQILAINCQAIPLTVQLPLISLQKLMRGGAIYENYQKRNYYRK
mgnify:CR=1 FL=1